MGAIYPQWTLSATVHILPSSYVQFSFLAGDPPELDNTLYHHGALTIIAKNNFSPRIHLFKVCGTPNNRSTPSNTFNFDPLFGSNDHIPLPLVREAGGIDDDHRTGLPFYGNTHEVVLSIIGRECTVPFGLSHCLSTPLADQSLLS